MKWIIYGIVLSIFMLSGCNNTEESKKINIAVTGSPRVYSEYYEKGIKKAYADVCKEYNDKGFDIKCNFYDDNDNYKTAEKITAKLVNDSNVTAVIASSSADICENQVYQTNKAGKILVCPHWMYDSTLEMGNYNKVFSINYSNKNIGTIMKIIIEQLSGYKWAVCYSGDKISRAEIKCLNESNNVNIVDYVKINYLMSDFNDTVKRWKLMDIKGVVLIPYDNEGFDLLYKLKQEMPEIYVVSDSDLDDDNELKANRKNFENVFLVDSFYVENGKSKAFADEEYIDTLEIHGYNAFRMVVDTAVKNNTDNPEKIAEILHKEGYKGELESYKFNEKGALEPEKFSYIMIGKDDVTEHIVAAKN